MEILSYKVGNNSKNLEEKITDYLQEDLLENLTAKLINNKVYCNSRLYFTNNYNNTYTLKFIDKYNKYVTIFTIKK